MVELGWDHYRSALAVLREGSLSRAARALGVTQPTIGRHLDALEEGLAVSLFRRSPSGLSPTEHMLALAPHAEAMASAADALVRASSAKPGEERGSVRVTASEIVGAAIVVPLLAPFRDKHPHVAIEMLLSSRSEDLLRGDSDIAVRLFRPSQKALVVRPAGVLEIGLHAHPRYLEGRRAPRTRADLAVHAMVGFDSAELLRRAAREGLPLERDALRFRSDSYLAQYAAIRAGLGIGLSPVALARRDGLVRVLAKVGTRVPVFMVMHENLKSVRRVRLLYDFLARSLAAFAAPALPR
jgi:DNA-binding transcriptional LysR family regulator